jgi:uncharacterized protein YqeY
VTEPTLPDRLRRDLVTAMKAGDRRAVAALRQALAALANAEAPPMPDGPRSLVPPPVGRLAEHPRLELTATDVERILRAEVAEHEAAAVEYLRIGREAEAADRAAEAAALRAYLR